MKAADEDEKPELKIEIVFRSVDFWQFSRDLGTIQFTSILTPSMCPSAFNGFTLVSGEDLKPPPLPISKSSQEHYKYLLYPACAGKCIMAKVIMPRSESVDSVSPGIPPQRRPVTSASFPQCKWAAFVSSERFTLSHRFSSWCVTSRSIVSFGARKPQCDDLRSLLGSNQELKTVMRPFNLH